MMMRPGIKISSFIFILSLFIPMVAVAPVMATTFQEEVELGEKLDVEILKENPQVKDEAAIKEINAYGDKLLKGSSINRPEMKYHFRILKQEDLNAFSTPGGYVYFSSHLWDILRPDERQGVLAHEIIHADRRHALDAMSKANRQSMWLGAILTVLGANRTAGDIVGLAQNVSSLNYSRGDERQADEIGVQLLSEANYNPAGLLLAMRKIGRFQAKAGGQPPKIFSSHPPTKERLQYITQRLKKMGVAIPAEDVKEIPNPNEVGAVTALSSKTIHFNSSKKLEKGDIVWLMGQGWDYRYENHIEVPVARGVVTSAGSTYQAEFALVPGAKSEEVAVGSGVYALPAATPPQAFAEIKSDKIIGKSPLNKLDRLMAVGQVWDNEENKVINSNVGYAIITDGSGRYIAASRPEYSYASADGGNVLVKLNDPDAKRWVGPIISIGKRGQTIEVLPNRELQAKRIYEVAAPVWSSKDKYESRLIGTAKVSSASGKIILKMLTFMPGKSIADISSGFDLYEEPRPAVEK